tara:strand:+ start:1528 stop:1716 length:189 start_codon:yes stop_codon:yes gene_type:complete
MKYYLVEKNGSYFAGYDYEEFHTGKRKKGLFRDLLGDVLDLGADKNFAEDWVQTKNEIDQIL